MGGVDAGEGEEWALLKKTGHILLPMTIEGHQLGAFSDPAEGISQCPSHRLISL